MYCLIKEWPNKMATLMTEDGVVLWTFNNVEEAREVWHAWSSLHNNKASNQTDYLDQSSMSECNILHYWHRSRICQHIIYLDINRPLHPLLFLKENQQTYAN